MTDHITRVFRSGNSQAVRIPAAYRIDADRVLIERNAAGDLVLHPLPRNRGEALLAALDGFDADFIAALETAREEPQPMQDRGAL
jgi:antitoxin VapB